jgi:hypothetical protein
MYKDKYLKYKIKYFNLRNSIGGDPTEILKILEELERFITQQNKLLTYCKDMSTNKFKLDKDIEMNTIYKTISPEIPRLLEYLKNDDKNDDKSDNIIYIINKIIELFKEHTEESNQNNIYEYLEYIIKHYFGEQRGGVLDIGPSGKIIDSLSNLTPFAKGEYGKIYDAPSDILCTYSDNKNADKINADKINAVIKHETGEISLEHLAFMEKIYNNYHDLEIGPKLYETYYKHNKGGIIMEKLDSDVVKLLTQYILTDAQIIDIESKIKSLFDKMFSKDSSYVCFDIKFQNMLVNFTVSSDDNITVDNIDKIVLTDFDKNFCVLKKENSSLSDEKYIILIKYLYFINLMLAQIGININRIKNYIWNKQFRISNIKLLSLFMDNITNIKIFFYTKRDYIVEKINDMIIKVDYMADIYTPIYYIFNYVSIHKFLHETLKITDLFNRYQKNELNTYEIYSILISTIDIIMNSLTT